MFLLQCHIIMTLFHSYILQDVERDYLNQLNACLINVLYIYYVLLKSNQSFYFHITKITKHQQYLSWPLLQWQIYIENPVIFVRARNYSVVT